MQVCSRVAGCGRSGPSSPLSPCTWAATSCCRMNGRVGAAVDGNVGAACELEDAQRVVRRLVDRWLPATVVTPMSSTSGEATASSNAIASSWPGIAVDDDRSWCHALSIASTSRAAGREGCAPRLEAASAPAAHARRSASSRSRPSSSETTRQAAKASPAAVPSSTSTRGGVARATSTPFSNSAAPAASIGDGDELPARDDFVLELIDDQQVRLDVDRACRRSVEREEVGAFCGGERRLRRAPRAAPSTAPPGDCGLMRAFAPGMTTI